MINIMKQKVIFICTGNSCRSQIAEGILRNIAGDIFYVFSAGLKPSFVNPDAIKVMNELDIDISNHTSDDVNKYISDEFDYIITVCDNAKESCPVFPGKGKRIHWSFKDPADAVGSNEDVLDEFRKVRDQIKSTLEQFINEQN